MLGVFYRLTDCHPLEEHGGMACFSSSRKHLNGVPGLTPRVEGDEQFLTQVFWGFKKRGEILGFMEDELLRKHLPRMFSLIKNES